MLPFPATPKPFRPAARPILVGSVRILLLAAAGAFFALAPTSCDFRDPGRSAVHLRRGDDWVLKKDYKDYGKAIAEYTEAIRLDPANARAFHRRGLAQIREGQSEEANRDLTAAIRLRPDDASLYFDRAETWPPFEESRTISDYSAAIRLEPRNAAAYYRRARSWQEQRDWKKALADYAEAIRLNPDDPIPRRDRGTALAQMGKLDEAIADFSEAIRLEPRSAYVFTERGNARFDRGEIDGALADYDEAIRLEPSSPWPTRAGPGSWPPARLPGTATARRRSSRPPAPWSSFPGATPTVSPRPSPPPTPRPAVSTTRSGSRRNSVRISATWTGSAAASGSTSSAGGSRTTNPRAFPIGPASLIASGIEAGPAVRFRSDSRAPRTPPAPPPDSGASGPRSSPLYKGRRSG